MSHNACNYNPCQAMNIELTVFTFYSAHPGYNMRLGIVYELIKIVPNCILAVST